METPKHIELTDEELRVVVQNIDLDILLEPIKAMSKQYKKYDKQLGPKDKNSLLVKKNLPRIAMELYKKSDPNFVSRIDSNIRHNLRVFDEAIKEYTENDSYLDILREYSASSYYDMLMNFEEVDPNNHVNLDLFFVQLKLSGVELEEDKKNEIVRLWNPEVQLDDNHEDDLINVEELDVVADEAEPETVNDQSAETPAPKKAKPKKLSPQEKAEKHKQAEKQKQELKEKAEEEKRKQEELLLAEQAIKEQDIEAELTVEQIAVTEDTEITEDIDMNVNEENKTIWYVGWVSVVGDFYNFTPIGTLENKRYNAFTSAEIEELVPLSSLLNINLYYNFRSPNYCEAMRRNFRNDSLILISFQDEDLEDSIVSGTRNSQTAYKIDCFKKLDEGKIKFLSDEGWYRVATDNMLISSVDDIDANSRIKLKSDLFVEGEKIFVRARDGFHIGPCEVKRDETRDELFVKLEAENKLLKGFAREDFDKELIELIHNDNLRSDYMWTYHIIKENAEVKIKDLTSNKDLLEAFKSELDSSGSNVIYMDGVDTILESYENSVFTSRNIPESIRKERAERVKDLLLSEAELSETFTNVADVLFEMIVKNKDNKNVEILIDTLLDERPELLENIQNMKIIKARLETERQKLDDIESRKRELESSNDEYNATVIADAKSEELNEKIREKQQELEAIESKLGELGDLDKLAENVKQLSDEKSYYTIHNQKLLEETNSLETKFTNALKEFSDKLVDVSFDGYISSKLLQSASVWEESERSKNLNKVVGLVNDVESFSGTNEDVVDYLVKTIQMVRPKYTRNVIVNIFVCAVQGFLTVLSGAPGCGKTSICNIISKVLGLTQFEDKLKGQDNGLSVNRYIPVSVERGWTSKRDFVGYYNPLTKMFEESNREVFDGLRILDIEAKNNINKYPFFILLDEANLSPMEYYWADFMNICDDLSDNHSINLGNNNVFTIPETLHFLATMNNDHTTETMSPRLIDRAWIINLPKCKVNSIGTDIPKEEIKQISWEVLKSIFVNGDTKDMSLDVEEQKIYDGIKEILAEQDIYISPRADIDIYNYWNVASKWMVEDDFDNTPSIIALDYAMVQKVLPKITGAGEEYRAWLEKLREYCKKKNLWNTQDMLETIINRGDRQMKYYEYFVKG